jgi:hypothetical protein
VRSRGQSSDKSQGKPRAWWCRAAVDRMTLEYGLQREIVFIECKRSISSQSTTPLARWLSTNPKLVSQSIAARRSLGRALRLNLFDLGKCPRSGM